MPSAVVPDYARPETIEEAVDLLGDDGAHALAGGTDVVTMRAAGTLRPACLVDVKGIPRLRGVAAGAGATAIGAATPLDALGALPPSALVDGAGLVGSWQTRTRATLGGNVCRASPAGDTLCALLVLGARLELVSATGARPVAAAEFFTGPGASVRAPGELLATIAIPHRRGGSAYRRFTYRNAMDLAVVGVAVWLELSGGGRCVDAAVAIGACGPVPRLVPSAAAALVGSTLDADAVAAACAAVTAAAEPIDDVRGTRCHRLRVLAPLTRRVVADAMARACA